MLDRLRPYARTSVYVALIAYFAIHALTGERGLLGERQREETLKARRTELAELQAQRRDLQARVRLLRDDHLSRDLLEERARVVLGFADPRDFVIRVQKPQQRPS
jgi:cell division protein FtsB